MVESKPRSIVGIMADVARINIGTYRCEQCTVWGIDEEEHAAFAKHGVDIHPRSERQLIMIKMKFVSAGLRWLGYIWPISTYPIVAGN